MFVSPIQLSLARSIYTLKGRKTEKGCSGDRSMSLAEVSEGRRSPTEGS